MEDWIDLERLLDRLAREGYEHRFVARPEGLYAETLDRTFEPEELAVDDVRRLDNDEDAGASRSVFSLRHPVEGFRGVYAAPAEPSFASDDARMSARLIRRSEAPERGFRVNDRRWWAKAEGQDEDESSESKPGYVQQLEEQLHEKDLKLREMVRRYAEANDEVERAKQRIEREAERQRDSQHAGFLSKFLELLDDVDRALAAALEEGRSGSLVDGVQLIQRRFISILGQQGVTRIEPQGEEFDPAIHEAVSMLPVQAEQDNGKVMHVVAPGYVRGKDVVRAAKVVVGRFAASGASA